MSKLATRPPRCRRIRFGEFCALTGHPVTSGYVVELTDDPTRTWWACVKCVIERRRRG